MPWHHSVLRSTPLGCEVSRPHFGGAGRTARPCVQFWTIGHATIAMTTWFVWVIAIASNHPPPLKGPICVLTNFSPAGLGRARGRPWRAARARAGGGYPPAVGGWRSVGAEGLADDDLLDAASTAVAAGAREQAADW